MPQIYTQLERERGDLLMVIAVEDSGDIGMVCLQTSFGGCVAIDLQSWIRFSRLNLL
ncbi:hypothetical protein Hanom_Chr05g00434941 [Helianthus anomalus]